MVMAKKQPPLWAKRLKALRRRLGISQAEAARRTGVALRTWIAWENRQNVPGRLTRRLLEIAFPEI